MTPPELIPTVVGYDNFFPSTGGNLVAPGSVGIELRIYDRLSPTTMLDVLPGRLDPTWLEELRGPGGGAFRVLKSDPKLTETPTLLAKRNIVRVYLDGRLQGAWQIRRSNEILVGEGEEAVRAIEVAGPGLRQLLEDAVVYPLGPLGRATKGERLFSFASPRGSWYRPTLWQPVAQQSRWDAGRLLSAVFVADAVASAGGASDAIIAAAIEAGLEPPAGADLPPTQAPDGKGRRTNGYVSPGYQLYGTETSPSAWWWDATGWHPVLTDISQAPPTHPPTGGVRYPELQAPGYAVYAQVDPVTGTWGVHDDPAVLEATAKVWYAGGFQTSGGENPSHSVAEPAPPGHTEENPWRWSPGAQDWASLRAPHARWIWDRETRPGQGGSAPAGDVYFRREFVVRTAGRYQLVVTADNAFAAYCDGAMVVQSADATAYANAYPVDLDLTVGSHVLAVKASNWQQGTAGVLCALVAYGDPAVPNSARALFVSDTSADEDGNRWLCVGYPEQPPGWTPGEVLRTLLSEAQARGVDSLAGLIPTFSDLQDSAGVPWDTTVDWSFGIGVGYDDVVTRIEELKADFQVEPREDGGLLLHAFSRRGVDRSSQVDVLGYGTTTTRLLPGTTHVAPSVEASGAGLLYVTFMTEDAAGNYGTIGGTTALTETDTTAATMRPFRKAITNAGPTGTQSVTFTPGAGTPQALAATSLFFPGSAAVFEGGGWAFSEGVLPLFVDSFVVPPAGSVLAMTLGVASGPLPETPPGTPYDWQRLTDGVDAGTGLRVRTWAARVPVSPGAVVGVTVPVTGAAMHARLVVVSGVVGTTRQPVVLRPGHNVTGASESDESDIKNVLLLASDDGWAELEEAASDAAYGRVEGFLSVGGPAAMAGQVGAATLEKVGLSQDSTTVSYEPVPEHWPWVDWGVGDVVLAPTNSTTSRPPGTLAARRVQSISISEVAETGRVLYASEFGTINRDRTERLERWLKSASEGTLGGSVANASGGATGSGSAPTTAPASTSPSAPLVVVNPVLIGEIISGANIMPGSIVASDKIVANSITAQSAVIADLAVTSAKIESITANKITAGTIMAEIALAGRIATSLDGARTEMNATGFHSFDSQNREVFTADVSGNVSLLGTLLTGFAPDARVEISTKAFDDVFIGNAPAVYPRMLLYSGMDFELSPAYFANIGYLGYNSSVSSLDRYIQTYLISSFGVINTFDTQLHMSMEFTQSFYGYRTIRFVSTLPDTQFDLNENLRLLIRSDNQRDQIPFQPPPIQLGGGLVDGNLSIYRDQLYYSTPAPGSFDQFRMQPGGGGVLINDGYYYAITPGSPNTPLQIGSNSSLNLKMSATSLLAANNGAGTTLYLNWGVGDVGLGKAGNTVYMAGNADVGNQFVVHGSSFVEALDIDGLLTTKNIYVSDNQIDMAGHVINTNYSLSISGSLGVIGGTYRGFVSARSGDPYTARVTFLSASSTGIVLWGCRENGSGTSDINVSWMVIHDST